MKWIGQHIYDLVARFRNDVYLEDLSTTTETNVLVVDSDGKVSKTTVITGDVTGVTAGDNITVTDPTGPVPTVALSTNVDVAGTLDVTSLGTFDGSITVAGNVGIGTASPSGNLHISSGTSEDCLLIIEADTDNNDENDTPQIWFKADGGLNEGLIGLNNNTLDLINNVSTSGGIRFLTGLTNNTGTTTPYTGATERMRITAAGIVKIAGLTSNGTVSTTSSNGTLTTSSDSNLKDADGFVENGLEKVLALKPRYFYWKDKEQFGDNRQLGFFAQEVNEISEETANTPSYGGGWGVYDRGLVALLTAAIQEQNQTIQDLKTRLDNAGL